MVSAVPMGDGDAVGGSRSLSREPGISLVRDSGAQCGGCAHSWGHGSVCAPIAPASRGMEGKWLCSSTTTSTSTSSAEGSSG